VRGFWYDAGMLNAEIQNSNNPFQFNQYVIKKRLLVILGAKLNIYGPDGTLLLVVKQKAFKLREDIRVYRDEALTQEVLCIKARKIMDFSAAYDVVDSRTNEKVGVFRRKGWSSIIRDSWKVLDANDFESGELLEDSMILALLRRFLSNLIPQNFDLNIQGNRVADYKQNFNPIS